MALSQLVTRSEKSKAWLIMSTEHSQKCILSNNKKYAMRQKRGFSFREE